MSQILLFAVCALFGVFLRVIYKLATMLEVKTNLIAVTIIMDILLVALAAIGYTAIIFLMCDGQILSYTIAALILGYSLTYIVF